MSDPVDQAVVVDSGAPVEGDASLDAAVIAAALRAIARDGWHGWSLARVAAEGGFDIARVRERFATPTALLRALARAADRAALAEPGDPAAPVTERLFDALMRRLDVLQGHRAGVLAVLRALPTDPALALALAASDLDSMRWLLDAAGIQAQGLSGALRAQGLLAVWLWTLRAWRRDDSPDLAATMATLDTALTRAATLARWVPDRRPEPG